MAKPKQSVNRVVGEADLEITITQRLATEKAMEMDYAELEAMFLEATNQRTTNIHEMTQDELMALDMALQFAGL